MKRDVETAVDEPSDARYFAQLSSSLFLKSKYVKATREDYSLMGNNCSKAVKGWVDLPVTSVGNNPLETFYLILTDKVLPNVDTSLREETQSEFKYFGIDRTVPEVSKQAAEYREKLVLRNVSTSEFKR